MAPESFSDVVVLIDSNESAEKALSLDRTHPVLVREVLQKACSTDLKILTIVLSARVLKEYHLDWGKHSSVSLG